MRKKGNKNKTPINPHQSGQSSSSLHQTQSQVQPPTTKAESGIGSIDNSYGNSKNSHYFKEQYQMTKDESFLCENSDDDDEQCNGREESVNEKVERRKRKKERQKERKLARKMAAKRRDSELSLGLEEFVDSEQGLSSQSSSNPSKTVKISLCRHPLMTLEYFIREISCLLCDLQKRCVASRRRRNGEFVCILDILLIFFISAVVLTAIYLWLVTNGPLAIQIKQCISWYAYWIFLGIMSSVGLGTGLHTFILYLGPFIAKVSLAAQECATLNFPQPPYPNQVTCPSNNSTGHHDTISILDVSAKVRWETLAWGFGTALGELPPYFIARAASLAGDKNNSDNLEHNEGFLAKVQLKMRDFVMKVGFCGILICASIPNPLFDLAGITCGHFQVPFLVFFGATAIGKTIIKSQLQMTFVILAFNEKSLGRVLESVGSIPKVGPSLRKVLTDFMDYQRAALHHQGSSQSGGILMLIGEIFVILVIVYFVGSIINGMASSYQRRISSKNKKANKVKKRLKSQT